MVAIVEINGECGPERVDDGENMSEKIHGVPFDSGNGTRVVHTILIFKRSLNSVADTKLICFHCINLHSVFCTFLFLACVSLALCQSFNVTQLLLTTREEARERERDRKKQRGQERQEGENAGTECKTSSYTKCLHT